MAVKNIFANAILVDVNISAWTAEKQLTAEDLGIDPKKLPKSFKLGKKALIPPEVIAKFKHLDYEARHLLKVMSYAFSFGQARLLPKKLAVPFDEQYGAIKVKYDAAVVDLVQNYNQYKRDMQKDFVEAAKEAYERIQKIQGACDKTQDEFINDFLTRIEKQYPSPDSIFARFDMDYAVCQTELPDLTEATIDDVAEEDEKRKLLEDAFQKKYTKSLESLPEKMVKENRERAKIVLDSLKDNLTGKKSYTDKTVHALETMIQEFLALDIMDDAQLKSALVNFKAKWIDGNTSKNIRNSAKLQSEMLAELTAITNTLLDAAEIKAVAAGYRQKAGI